MPQLRVLHCPLCHRLPKGGPHIPSDPPKLACILCTAWLQNVSIVRCVFWARNEHLSRGTTVLRVYYIIAPISICVAVAATVAVYCRCRLGSLDRPRYSSDRFVDASQSDLTHAFMCVIKTTNTYTTTQVTGENNTKSPYCDMILAIRPLLLHILYK